MSIEHDALAEDLALSLGILPYLNVVLGSPWLAAAHEAPPRADVLGIKPSYTRFCVTIYEIKVSRSDFLSDIRSGAPYYKKSAWGSVPPSRPSWPMPTRTTTRRR